MRKIYLLTLVFSMLVFLVACSSENEKASNDDNTNVSENSKKEDISNNDENSKEKEHTSEDPLAAVLKYFEEHGLVIGDKTGKAFDMLGAVNGFGVEVNGQNIELYLYDLEKADDSTLESLESVKANGMMTMSGFSFSAKINGNLLLTAYDEHPDKDKIVELFSNFR